MQDKFERAEIADMYAEAAGTGIKWEKTSAYVFTHKRKFELTEIEKPKYWNENISTDDMFKPVPIWRRII